MFFTCSVSAIQTAVAEINKVIGKLDDNSINSCVIVTADEQGVFFIGRTLGQHQTTWYLPDTNVFRSGSYVIPLIQLIKKVKFLEEDVFEFSVSEAESKVYIVSGKTKGSFDLSIYDIDDYELADNYSSVIANVDEHMFGSWVKIIDKFCGTAGNVTIYAGDSYLEACGFAPGSHQTMMLYTRIALLQSLEPGFSINVNSSSLSSLFSLGELENGEVSLVTSPDDTDTVNRVGVVAGQSIWWCFTSLGDSTNYIDSARYCSDQVATSSLTLEKSLFTRALQHIDYQPNAGVSSMGVELCITSEDGLHFLQLVNRSTEVDVVSIPISNYQGSFVPQSFDASKILTILSPHKSSVITLQQFVIDENSHELALRIQDLQEQSRLETYLEGLVS